MTITTPSSREFNQDTSRSKKAAKHGPVFVTDCGRPSHVLLTIEEYRRLTGGAPNIVDLLGTDETDAIGFEPPKLEGLARPADL